MKHLIIIALLFAALLFAACSEPPSEPTPPGPTDTTQASLWRSNGTPGSIIWEIRSGTVWLCPPYDSPEPYALATVAAETDSLRIDAYHESAPKLVYSFALGKTGQQYAGWSYSKYGHFPRRFLTFTKIQ